MTSIPPLAGWCVAVTADRRCEEQVTLLQRRGADVVVAPAIRTRPLLDSEQLTAAIEDLVTNPPETLVLLTGIGTRAMFGAAESIGCDAALLDALAGAEVIVRGPKAAGAATTIGLDVAWNAPGERASEILERLRDDAARGARIAVQRDGMSRAVLADALAALGADAVDIPVYCWELPDDVRPAVRLLEAIVEGEIDAITFTSSPAVRHLIQIADAEGRRGAVLTAFERRVAVACVGPVCRETAESLGVPVAVVPRRARLGAMVQSLVSHFEGRTTTVPTHRGDLAIQGRAVFVDGAMASLGARERSVLEMLIDARGAVVPKQRLLRAVWGTDFADEHAVEVAVARLRRGLGPAGAAVETIARRGYRLAG